MVGEKARKPREEVARDALEKMDEKAAGAIADFLELQKSTKEKLRDGTKPDGKHAPKVGK